MVSLNIGFLDPAVLHQYIKIDTGLSCRLISIETVPNRLLKQSSLIEPCRTTKYQDIMQQTKMPLPLGQRLCIRPLTPSHHLLDCEVYGIRTNAPMHAITIAAHNVWFVYRCYTYIVCAFKTYMHSHVQVHSLFS